MTEYLVVTPFAFLKWNAFACTIVYWTSITCRSMVLDMMKMNYMYNRLCQICWCCNSLRWMRLNSWVEAALHIPWSDSDLCLWYCLAFHVKYMPRNSVWHCTLPYHPPTLPSLAHYITLHICILTYWVVYLQMSTVPARTTYTMSFKEETDMHGTLYPTCTCTNTCTCTCRAAMHTRHWWGPTSPKKLSTVRLVGSAPLTPFSMYIYIHVHKLLLSVPSATYTQH